MPTQRSQTLKLATGFAASLLLLLSGSAHAADLLVPTQYPTIQAAVTAANDGDRVLVRFGNYTGPGNRDIDLRSKNITVQSEDENFDNCVIDCQDAGRAFRTGNARTRISGFTIANGRPVDDGTGVQGGAILIEAGATEINKCHFQGNTAAVGGSLYVTAGSDLLLTDCSFVSGLASGGGGGALYLSQSSQVTGLRCSFVGNIASGYGGAIDGESAQGISLINCSFTRNKAFFGGGGVNAIQTSLSLQNCVLDSNNGGQYGGGVVIDHGAANISSCTFSGNFTIQGGAIAVLNSLVTINNSILWGDAAAFDKEIALFLDVPLPDTPSNILIANSNIEGGLPTGVNDGGGNINQNPQFVRAAQTNGPDDNGDLRLLSISPSVDAGNNTYLPPDTYDMDGDGDTTERQPLDLLGTARLVGGTVDQGAHELPATPGVDVRMAFTLTRDTNTGEILATVTLRNRGVATATGVQLTDLRLGGTAPIEALPSPTVSLDGATVNTQTFRFPSASAGQRTILKVIGSYQGGTFGGTYRVSIP